MAHGELINSQRTPDLKIYSILDIWSQEKHLATSRMWDTTYKYLVDID
jgi:hypothetical protein